MALLVAVGPQRLPDWDFSARNLRSTRWLHQRVDVDFNGWFMCLIPRAVLEEIGLSLPLFIKWDDSEFGLRAKAAGYPTVTFPGAAVWHIPWTDKNDALDWQAYFHQRNRFVAALLHSPYPNGGRMVRESLQPPDQAPGLDAVLHRRDAPPGAAGRARRTRTRCTRRCRPGCRDPRVPQAVHRRPARVPTPTPSRRSSARKPPRKGRDGVEVPGGRASSPCARCCTPLRQLSKPRDAVAASTPRPRSRRWTPSGTAWPATTRRSCR